MRIKLPRNHEVRFEDTIRSWVSVNTNNMDDKVLFKSDGMPTYHLANIVDDHLMGITHVIRGEEWLPSAPLHVMLYEAFGWDCPVCAPALLLKPDGPGKLKRDGDRLGFPVFPQIGTTLRPVKRLAATKSQLLPRRLHQHACPPWLESRQNKKFSTYKASSTHSTSVKSLTGAKFDFEKENGSTNCTCAPSLTTS